jgi:Fe2+ transport system protein B
MIDKIENVILENDLDSSDNEENTQNEEEIEIIEEYILESIEEANLKANKERRIRFFKNIEKLKEIIFSNSIKGLIILFSVIYLTFLLIGNFKYKFRKRFKFKHI